MRPILVVVSAPLLQLFAGICKRQEPVCVQALRPEPPVERFDVGIVCRLAGPGEVQRDVVGIGPQVQVAADELGALVDPDRLRIANHGAGHLEGLDDVFATLAEALT